MPTTAEILADLAPYCVVVGSHGRGAPNPRDIDLLYDQEHEETIRWLIRDHGVRFDSVLPGHWKLVEYDIELLPFHEGPDYAVCRAHAYAITVHRVEMLAYNDLRGQPG